MEIYAKLTQVKDLAKRVMARSTILEQRLKALESSGFQQNAIEKIKMNGTALPVTDKTVNIPVPTTTAQLTNDAGFIKKADARTVAQEEIAKSGYLRYKIVPELPSAEEADEHIWYLLYNGDTGHFDIYALMAGEMSWLDDTTIDLSDYITTGKLKESQDAQDTKIAANAKAIADEVTRAKAAEAGKVDKVEGKGLSSNDFTAAEKEKLTGVEANANNYQLTKQKVVDALGYTPGNADNPQSVDWANVTGKPTSYPASAHDHDDRYYTESEVDTKLSGKLDTDGATRAGFISDFSTAIAESANCYMGSYHNNADNFNNFISIRHRNGLSDGPSYGLLIRSGLTWDDSLYFRHQYSGIWQAEKTLLDNSNFGEYALPLNGGTMNGNLHFADVGDSESSAGITFAGSTDGASIYYQTTGADQGNLVLNLTDDSNCYLQIAKNGEFKSYFSPDDGAFHGSVYGRIVGGASSTWLYSRNSGCVYSNPPTNDGYVHAVTQKTKDGAWGIGALDNNNSLMFSYTTDADIDIGNNHDAHLEMYPGDTGRILTSNNINGYTAGNAIKWSGQTLRQNHNTADTWIPVFTGDSCIDYVLKGEIAGLNGVAASGSSYVRFTDGTQICKFTSSSPGPNSSNTVYFPASFVNATYGVIASEWSGASISISNRTTSTITISGGSTTGSYSLIAMGRWK